MNKSVAIAKKTNSQQLTFLKKPAVAFLQKVSCCFFAKSQHLHAGFFRFLLLVALLGLLFCSPASASYLPVTGSNIGIGTSTPVGGLVVMNGNVGIGTWSPTARLEVKSRAGKIWTGTGSNANATAAGELYVEGDLEVDGTLYGNGANILNVVADANGWTDAITNVFVTTTTDNVAIGTTTPKATLLIENISAVDSFRVNHSLLDTAPFVIGPAGNVGVGTTTAGSLLSVSGGGAIGSSQAYTTLAAPANGLIVEGNMGVGTTAAANKLTVSGGQTIGSGFVATAAPTGGLLVQGQVGIGTTKSVGGLSVMAGNVGIGTFSPSAFFEVTSGDQLDMVRINNNGPGDTAPFVIDRSGCVGIGTFLPGAAYRLEVVGDIEVLGGDLNFGHQAIDNDEYIGFVDTDGYISGVTSSGLFSFQTDTTRGNDILSPRASIAAEGAFFQRNVGLGTSLPNAFLDISSTSAQDLMLVNDNGTGDTTPFLIDRVGNVGIGTSVLDYAFVIDSSADGSGNRFVVDPLSGPSNRSLKMSVIGENVAGRGGWVFQSSFTDQGVTGDGTGTTIGLQTLGGNVGIGTFDAIAILEISVTSAKNLFLVSDGGSGDLSPFSIESGGNVGIGTVNARLGTLVIDRGNIGFGTLNPVAGLSVMTGNVGIGTWSPISRLEVKSSGSAQFTINGPSGGCIMFRDTDDAGWTECNYLNGVRTCSIDADGICDGT